jgi:hypothetical protein
MDYVIFAIIILALGGMLFLVNRMDKSAKNKYRKEAYTLLESPSPDTKEIKKTLKGLSLYGGRWRKDKEFVQLIKRLSEKLDKING